MARFAPCASSPPPSPSPPCSRPPPPPRPSPISPDRLAAHVKALADPKLAGRAPGGPGEAGTIEYIVGQFKALGLQAGRRQRRLDAGRAAGALPGAAGGREIQPRPPAARPGRSPRSKDVMVWTQRPIPRVADRERAAGLRRLRRHRAGARLGRLQGRRPEGQDRRRPDQRPRLRGRPPAIRSPASSAARRPPTTPAGPTSTRRPPGAARWAR